MERAAGWQGDGHAELSTQETKRLFMFQGKCTTHSSLPLEVNRSRIQRGFIIDPVDPSREHLQTKKFLTKS